jgi:hypothetical protein
MSAEKQDMVTYLQRGRDAVVWKLEGLSEYDVRRPLVPSGTNLLGMVKHLAAVEGGYLGAVFGRPFPEPMPWLDIGADVNADMWATAEESRDELLGLYRRVWSHADATIENVDLTDVGTVPWWPEERRHPTLCLILTHLIAEVHRHAGHADIVRELIDGAAGISAQHSNLPEEDATWWRAYRAKVEQAAVDAEHSSPG